MYRSLHFWVFYQFFTLCVWHIDTVYLCGFHFFVFLFISSIPLLSVSFLYFAVNLHRRFWITLFYHHFVYKTCSVFFLYILWNIMHWSRGTWLYIFLFIELSWKKTGNDNLFIIMYLLSDIAHILLGKKVFLNTNVRECDIGFQNTCILFHD